MPREQFHYHEKGNHDETWHYLCESEDGALHVETEHSSGPGRGSGEVIGPHLRSIEEFLASGQGTAQDKLRALLEERGISGA